MNTSVFIFTVALIGLVSCQSPLFNASFIELVQDIVEDSSKDVGEGVKNSSESVLDMGIKIKDAMEELLEDTLDLSNDNGVNSTEFSGIDVNGCNRGLRTQLEDKCDLMYDQVNEEAQQIEDDREKIEAVCCALEDFEKCSLRAYDKANCVTDKAAIKENLKAARLFLSVVADISCTEFRGQCAFYNSGASEYSTSFKAMIVSAVALVPFLV